MADQEMQPMPELLRRFFERRREMRAQGWSEEKIPTRQARSLKRLLASADAPLDAIEALRAVKRTAAMDLAQRFVAETPEAARVLALFGQRGVGKTVAATWALGTLLQQFDLVDRPSGDEVRQRGFGYFVHATRLSRYLGDKAAGEWFDRLNRCGALCLDDLGKEPLTGYRLDEFKAGLFEILNTRHANRRRTILTSNLSAADFTKRYGAPLADRLRDFCIAEELSGESMRGRGKEAV